MAEIVIFGVNKIVCTKYAIPLLSACRLFYLYKKVPARQTSPIDKKEELKSQHFEYNPNQMCDTVLTMNVLADGCTEINYTCIIPQYIDFVNRVFTTYSVFCEIL